MCNCKKRLHNFTFSKNWHLQLLFTIFMTLDFEGTIQWQTAQARHLAATFVFVFCARRRDSFLLESFIMYKAINIMRIGWSMNKSWDLLMMSLHWSIKYIEGRASHATRLGKLNQDPRAINSLIKMNGWH